MSYAEEFQTVDLILRSPAETRGVDAFALSLLKAEKQVRKLVTYLVFQHPCFKETDVSSLRETLGKNRRVFFDGFERGFDAISPHPICELVGSDYKKLRARIDDAVKWRNKIFHGQLTDRRLSRKDLLNMVTDIRSWCRILAKNAEQKIGYDGFARNSYRKSERENLAGRLNLKINDIAAYRRFINRYMQR